MSNPVSWFEIPAQDLERAKDFYTKVFGGNFQYIEMPDSKMYMFEGDSSKDGSMGAIYKDADSKPSGEGTTVYFGSEDVAIEAGKVEGAGGNILFGKTSIGEFGFIAQFMDTEGNRVGLHSNK